MRRALKVIVLSIAAFAMVMPATAPESRSAGTGATTWTIMLYMAGNANPELPWQQNLNAMEAAEQAQGTNILALVDPFGGGNTTLYRIAHDPAGLNSEIVSPTVDDGGVVIPVSTNNSNMASPSTLSSFIEFSAANYPADRYVLILWGHGAVWYGLCPDGTDILTLPELRIALSSASAVIGRALDLMGVDACAEATLEMFYEIHEYVRYFVGSEKDVPSQGLPYRQVFDSLATNVNQSAADYGIAIANDYLAWSRTNSFYSATMSVFDLTKMPAFIDRFDSWVRFGARFEGLFHTELQDIFNVTEHYETEWQDDFGGLASKMASLPVPVELQMKSADALTAFKQMRVYSDSFDNPDAVDGVRAKEPTGAVVYAPSTAVADRSYEYLQIASNGWVEYSHMLRRINISNATVEVPTLAYESVQDFGAGLFDTVTVNWTGSYQELDVWVFREQAGELVYIDEYTSSGSSILVHGPNAIGSLVISASAGPIGVAISYARLGPVPVTGEVTVNVTLVGTADQEAPVRLVIKTNTSTTYVNTTDTADHVVTVKLLTPRDVEFGDTVIIEAEVGENLIGSEHMVLNGTSANLTIDLSYRPSQTTDWMLILGMAALAACLVLIFAILMYRERKKNTV